MKKSEDQLIDYLKNLPRTNGKMSKEDLYNRVLSTLLSNDRRKKRPIKNRFIPNLYYDFSCRYFNNFTSFCLE